MRRSPDHPTDYESSGYISTNWASKLCRECVHSSLNGSDGLDIWHTGHCPGGLMKDVFENPVFHSHRLWQASCQFYPLRSQLYAWFHRFQRYNSPLSYVGLQLPQVPVKLVHLLNFLFSERLCDKLATCPDDLCPKIAGLGSCTSAGYVVMDNGWMFRDMRCWPSRLSWLCYVSEYRSGFQL